MCNQNKLRHERRTERGWYYSKPHLQTLGIGFLLPVLFPVERVGKGDSYGIFSQRLLLRMFIWVSQPGWGQQPK